MGYCRNKDDVQACRMQWPYCENCIYGVRTIKEETTKPKDLEDSWTQEEIDAINMQHQFDSRF